MALALDARLEAVLFASGEPLTKKRLMSLLEASAEDLKEAADVLEERLEESGISLIRTTDELELRTAAEAAEDIKVLRESELSRDLGKASLETMAMIVYRGGATRGG